MIRGHIDRASRTRVEGWIFSERMRLTGQTVLAFVDDDYVGGGKVDLFRQDLADAGLGDGVVGFGFSVMLEPWHDPRALDVRLDGGTMQLRQTEACLVPRESVGEDRRRQGRDPASLSFMLAKGWMPQVHYETLRILGEFGVRVQTLPFAPSPAGLGGAVETFAHLAADVLELHALQPIELEIREGVRAPALATLRAELRAAFPYVPPVIGLWDERRSILNVVEGSHRGGGGGLPGGAVEYEFGGRDLLMLDLDATATWPDVAKPVIAFVPNPPRG